ncbi:hypothetical protein [Desulfobacula sp.]|uniref:hypothetical protein n=1 Tax=Desulfobacula sp. TaxID=2593537 RepID=UPI0026121F0A|nr:hypothetical protein [Desulfobacula sp.]
MELLIIKSGRDYLRFKDDGPLFVGLEKASVFPLDQLEKVQTQASSLKKNGFPDVCIKKLVLTEEELST